MKITKIIVVIALLSCCTWGAMNNRMSSGIKTARDLSGDCGTGVTYTYSDSTQTLTITGTGNMDFSTAPWASVRKSIKTVVIEEGVTSIGRSAFSSCFSLESISIPSTVTSIGENAFFDCRKLSSITLPPKLSSIGEFCFVRCYSIETIEVPSTLSTIPLQVFQDCTGLTSVIIHEGVETIGTNAFVGCSSLKTVSIPGSVTSISPGAFSHCTSLTSIIVAASNTNYISTDSAVFTRDMKTMIQFFLGLSGDYTIPDTVTSIGTAFVGCSLTSVTVPSTFTSIGESAFSGCAKLKTVNLPPHLTAIQGSAFRGCSSLTNITIPPGVQSISGNTFYECTSLNSITLPPTVRTIGMLAFSFCSNLEYVAITSDFTSISDNAFQSCSKLKTFIYSGTTVPDCSSSAFSKCNALEYVSAPIDYDNDAFCGKPVYSKTANISNELSEQHNHCYEVIVGNISGDDAFAQKRASVTLWEKQIGECKQYICENDTGYAIKNTCTQVYSNNWIVQIGVEVDGLDIELEQFDATDFITEAINLTGEEGQVVKYGEMNNEGNKRVLWIQVKSSSEESANVTMERINAAKEGQYNGHAFTVTTVFAMRYEDELFIDVAVVFCNKNCLITTMVAMIILLTLFVK